jgi:hypothetical protein
VLRLIGDVSVMLACALALGGIVAGVRAARQGGAGLMRQVNWFAYVIFGLMTL